MRQKIFTFICAVVIVFSVWKIAQYFYDYREADEQNAEAQQIVAGDSLESLQKQYPSVIGWIHIDDTKIDYPVVQAEDNEFFLKHNYKGERKRTGAIFLDYRNDAFLQDQHSIIYGHDLRNGSMFGSLSQYADEQFAKSHRNISLEVKGEQIILEVFAAYETTTDFYYIETNFSQESFQSFIQTITDKSTIKVAHDVTTRDKIVTLSTCVSDDESNKRFVVHAKVVERKGKST